MRDKLTFFDKEVIRKICFALAFILAMQLFEMPVSAKEAANKAIPNLYGDIIPASDLVYNGEEQPLVSNASDTKYFYSLTEDGKYTEVVPTGKNAGSYNVYYNTVSDNSIAPKLMTVTIDQKLLTEEMVVVEQPEQYYTGKLVWLSFYVTDKSRYGKELILASDYSVSGVYGGIEKGEYAFTVTGQGNYKGAVEKKWSITDKVTPETGDNTPEPDNPDNPDKPDDPGVIERKYDEVVVAGQMTLIYTRFDQNLGIAKYSISGKANKKIATVSKKGVLKPKRDGVVTINAYKKVKVKGRKTYVPVASYTVKVVVPEVTTGKIRLRPGQTISANDIIKNFSDIPADTQTFKFKSTKPVVADFIEGTGTLVAGDYEGKTQIIITIKNKDKKKLKIKKTVRVKITQDDM